MRYPSLEKDDVSAGKLRLSYSQHHLHEPPLFLTCHSLQTKFAARLTRIGLTRPAGYLPGLPLLTDQAFDRENTDPKEVMGITVIKSSASGTHAPSPFTPQWLIGLTPLA